jgi:hypothetical protein
VATFCDGSSVSKLLCIVKERSLPWRCICYHCYASVSYGIKLYTSQTKLIVLGFPELKLQTSALWTMVHVRTFFIVRILIKCHGGFGGCKNIVVSLIYRGLKEYSN